MSYACAVIMGAAAVAAILVNPGFSVLAVFAAICGSFMWSVENGKIDNK